MKATPLKIILVLVAVAITAGLVSWLKISKTNAEAETEKIEIANNTFSEDHFNLMNPDTFAALINRVYQPNVTTQIRGDKLLVSLQGANAITKDFFNGNDALLKEKLSDNGFEITYDKNNNGVESTFLIKDNAVAVPNDVLIKIADKIAN